MVRGRSFRRFDHPNRTVANTKPSAGVHEEGQITDLERIKKTLECEFLEDELFCLYEFDTYDKLGVYQKYGRRSSLPWGTAA